VDVIISGHSHTKLDDLTRVKDLDGKDVIIVSDWRWGLEVGQLSIDF
jgi:2',3'-cyclic-nucleotide 2'-phosphodiesterase (5'-nucleotidase family)